MWGIGPSKEEERTGPSRKLQVIAATTLKTSLGPNPEFIGDRGTEICVVCGADTGIPSELEIGRRVGYVVGAGQCCRTCAEE